MRPLGFGEIVDGAVQLYRRDFALYYLIVLVCLLPNFVVQVVWNPFEALERAGGLADDPASSSEALLSMLGELGNVFLFSLFGLVLAWFAALSLTVAMAEHIEERPISLGRAYAGALRRIHTAAGASIVAVLIFVVVGAVVLLFSMAVFVASALVGSNWIAVAGFVFVAVLMLATFAFWFGVTFGIFPAIVLEGRTAMDALQRSLSLCRGGWLRVIGIMTVAQIINQVPGMAIAGSTGLWELFQPSGDVSTVSDVQQWVLNAAGLVLQPLTLPLMMGSVMVLFHDRRVRSEGYDLERLADDMRAAAR